MKLYRIIEDHLYLHCSDCGRVVRVCEEFQHTINLFNLGPLDVSVRCKRCKDDEYLRNVMFLRGVDND